MISVQANGLTTHLRGNIDFLFHLIYKPIDFALLAVEDESSQASGDMQMPVRRCKLWHESISSAK